MKQFKILSILAFSLIFISCKQKTKKDKTDENTTQLLVNKIEVIDFHSTHRCMTCNAIEASTKYTLETYFSEELEKEIITFQVVNVDEEENFKVAEKFEATGTSLFLNVIKDGKEKQIDLTEFAFMKGNEKEAFATELKSKIEMELKNI